MSSSEDDFADERRAERKRPLPPPKARGSNGSCKQDEHLVARVLALAELKKPIAEMDTLLRAAGVPPRMSL